MKQAAAGNPPAKERHANDESRSRSHDRRGGGGDARDQSCADTEMAPRRGIPQRLEADRDVAIPVVDSKGSSDGVDDSGARPVAVYRLYDREGALIYIGASVRPWQRIASHISQRHRLGGPVPTAFGTEIDRDASVVTWFASRRRAEVAEAAEIADERPRYNVQGVLTAYRPLVVQRGR